MGLLGDMLFLFGVFQWSVWIISVSGGPAFTINVSSNSIIHINRSTASRLKCEVCTGNSCKSSLMLSRRMDVVFSCSQPEAVFMVEIVRHIVCTTTCNGTITPEDYPSLQNFNRTFTWNVKVQGHKAFSLDFTRAGLRQIQPTEQCQDKHIYTVSTGTVKIGKFCRQGTIRSMQVLREGIVSLQVPGKQQLNAVSFGVSTGLEIISPAIINVTLPEEPSSQEFFSPNYPESFPDDDLITWAFQVPYKYYSTVRILNYTVPRCDTRDTRMEYQLYGRTMVKKLSEAQLTEHQGSFNLSLQNCHVDTHSSSTSLTLHFKVSAIRRGSEVRCSVDLKKEKHLLIHIMKKKPKSDCILKLNSLAQETATIPSGKVSYVSFIDCQEEDLLITINKTIACQQLGDCPDPGSLGVPELDKCILGVVQEVRWNLYGPQNGAVELVSSAGNLQQSLPGHTCDNTVLLTVSQNEPQGVTVGQFCPQGAIHKMQINVANITVSASPAGGKNLRQITKSFLHVSFTNSVKEHYIFTVLPKKDIPVLLATPAWPLGMKAYATVSWFVSFPAQLEAHVSFTNVSQLTCQNRPAYIKLHRERSQDKMYSWQDQNPKDVVIPESFFLNMSNCLPVKGAFSVVSQVTLHMGKSVRLSIILSVVGVVLLLMAIMLAVFCIMRKKKKQQSAPEVSVYNPNRHPFLPGLARIPQETSEEDFHIYHSIDDYLVYGHLLKDSVEMNEVGKPAVGVYRDFTGPTEQQPLTDDGGGEEPEVGVYRPFTGPQTVPDVPDILVRPGENLTCKDKQKADEEIGGGDSVRDQETVPNIQRAPKAEPEED
ncbi:CUB domain-containing protein 1a isoform X2 [Pangasianodon hypophthalmus]|uniref:CUB domain-containing protein 1a isoform X2 n=1 Tax=Pangasianodon hypophthalmus TaxID=310915 RepID=UPI000EFDB6ED|nr:CUB domain-containing protein 1a isoform X2 [Pangasianodon hypophthalmus]